jgi:hypothetical protein
MLLSSIIGVVTLVGICGWLLQWPSERHVALFAASYSVPVTAGNRRMLERYIWWSRAWRIGGGAAGLVVTGIVGRSSAIDVSGLWQLTMALGYGLGAAAGEITRPRPRSRTGPRRASLGDRRITDYVRPWLPWAIAIMALAAAASATIYADLAPTSTEAERLRLTTAAAARASTIAAALVAALAVVVARRLARRPQPPESVDLESVHHAIRSAAIVSLLGASLMLLGVAANASAWPLALLDSDRSEAVRWMHNTLTIAANVAVFAGFMLSVRAIPRWGGFWRRLPPVPALPSDRQEPPAFPPPTLRSTTTPASTAPASTAPATTSEPR